MSGGHGEDLWSRKVEFEIPGITQRLESPQPSGLGPGVQSGSGDGLGDQQCRRGGMADPLGEWLS